MSYDTRTTTTVPVVNSPGDTALRTFAHAGFMVLCAALLSAGIVACSWWWRETVCTGYGLQDHFVGNTNDEAH
jgi:hypothetical protein